MESLDQDLSGLRPHRFLRHSVTITYLQRRFPTIDNPNLADLHVSLANCEHIRAYILQVQKNCFPFGTGWKGSYSVYFISSSLELIGAVFTTGLCYLKECQDRDLSPELHYVRYVGEVPVTTIAIHKEHEPEESLCIVICMTKESSRRLLHAQYLQSDIAFKRIAGFLKFEIGGWNENAKICEYFLHLSVYPALIEPLALTYCRVFVNCQSAAAHHLIFQKIETIVQQNTGECLRWRQLHAKSLCDLTGILQWMGNQHGGQAKGDVLLSFSACLVNSHCIYTTPRPQSSPQGSCSQDAFKI